MASPDQLGSAECGSQQEIELRRIVNLAPQMLTVMEPYGYVSWVNQTGLDYLGISLEDLSAAGLLARVYHPDDVQRFTEDRRSAHAEGVPFETEQRLRGKDGEYRWFLIRYRPLKDAEGRVLRWYGGATDISERKLAEQERERLHQLQAEFAHISRLTAMGELTASLAHDVNQPITAAVTNAQTCIRWLAGDAPNIGRAQEAAMRAVKEATRAAEMIVRVRQLFKKNSPQFDLISINDLIPEMVLLLRSEAMRQDVSIRTELTPALEKVMGDRVQLQQVLMNLMVNSIEAMKQVEGPRELTIESHTHGDNQLLVSVADTGIGLPAEAAHLFDAFFTTKAEGTGMGLAISRSIVEAHGGRLWAASNSDSGATFYFTLPTNE